MLSKKDLQDLKVAARQGEPASRQKRYDEAAVLCLEYETACVLVGGTGSRSDPARSEHWRHKRDALEARIKAKLRAWQGQEEVV